MKQLKTIVAYIYKRFKALHNAQPDSIMPENNAQPDSNVSENNNVEYGCKFAKEHTCKFANEHKCKFAK